MEKNLLDLVIKKKKLLHFAAKVMLNRINDKAKFPRETNNATEKRYGTAQQSNHSDMRLCDIINTLSQFSQFIVNHSCCLIDT